SSQDDHRASSGRTIIQGPAALTASATRLGGLGAAGGSGGQAPLVTVTPVPLNPTAPSQHRIGTLAYAGGLILTSADDSGFHDLSDLEVSADGWLVAIGDKGQFVRARLAFDDRGHLTGLTDLVASRLRGLDGAPLRDKQESDAEGLARLGNGDLLVSFEQQHRIWRYPADGAPPQPVSSPAGPFSDNAGLEALSADPDRGPNAYLVGAEESGQTWRCAIDTACEPDVKVDLPPHFGLVAIRTLPQHRRAWLLRAAIRGNSRITNAIAVRITDADGQTLDEQRLQPPVTVDNLEGLSVVTRPDGTLRFYLVSDDNTPTLTQRTLLLAFDWRP
ncbi:MAG: esterase-like activity of phytase family protein, partial [Vicinamibacterales bacterium]